jgi:elongation factor P
VCMDKDTFDQIYLDKALLGDSVNYIKEGVTLLIAFENGTNPITAEAPQQVVVNITYTEPGVQGDTATRTLKAATIETGAEIRVPLFINTGDNVKIDTHTGEYIERVK